MEALTDCIGSNLRGSFTGLTFGRDDSFKDFVRKQNGIFNKLHRGTNNNVDLLPHRPICRRQ